MNIIGTLKVDAPGGFRLEQHQMKAFGAEDITGSPEICTLNGFFFCAIVEIVMDVEGC